MTYIDDFLKLRLGMFIHFGAYAVPASSHGAEWIASVKELSIEEYNKYIEKFNPIDFDAKEWAKQAKKAGMKYAVLTAKHHDGYCLFESQYTDYSTYNYIGRDLIKEYVEAFRGEGIKVGIYYSLIDWHHPDFPAYGDRQAPMRNNEAIKDLEKDKNINNYISYMHNQIYELLTSYGTIDILWLDFSYKNNPAYGIPDMIDTTWKAEELIENIRKINPNIIMNNRLSINMHDKNKTDFYGDFVSPERIIPADGIRDIDGNPIPWEACITLNNYWGYVGSDLDYKSSKDVIRGLVECTSKNGNLLINVGPNARGKIPKQEIEILNDLGEWMDEYGESIYECGMSILSKPEWGRYTQKGDTIYAHIFERGIGYINFNDMNGKVGYSYHVSDYAEIELSVPWNAKAFKNDLFYKPASARLPNEIDTVIALTLNEGKVKESQKEGENYD